MSGVHAKFEQHDIDDKRTGFAVTPARSYSDKLAIVFALAFMFAVFVVFRVEGNDLLGTIRLVIMLFGGWWVYKKAYRWSEVVTDKLPGGQFVASFAGIELPDGDFIPRDYIQKISIGNSGGKGRRFDVSRVLEVETPAGPRWIVGGMDYGMGEDFLEAVTRALGFKVINATSPEASHAGIKHDDVLLTEVSSDVFEVQRHLGDRYIVVARPSGDLANALEVARKYSGTVWLSKLADRGALPILVPTQ